MADVVALDLGSTHVKGAFLSTAGTLERTVALPSPPLRGEDPVLEADAEGYVEAARRVLEQLAPAPGTKLGVASQRSSFLLWDRDGTPVTPLVSWQDRRAAAWCEAHAGIGERLGAITGLRLSPHYAGPKLAVLGAENPALERGMAEGTLCFGTLDSYLIWRLSGGRVHETDLTMAARTLLADPHARAWSPELLSLFGVSPRGLPAIVPTSGRDTPCAGGLRLTVSVADQAAAVAATLGEDEALVNLGTGGFVLRRGAQRRPGYLTGPVLDDGRELSWAVEGTINGIGPVLARFGAGPTPLPARDPAPGAFCLPDGAGVGAPHWRPRQGFALSPQAAALAPHELRRVVLEGVVFRVWEILVDLGEGELRRILLSGGIGREPFVEAALSVLAGGRVVPLEEPEATLLGAARLAGGLTGPVATAARGVAMPLEGRYLPGKFRAWRTWVAELPW